MIDNPNESISIKQSPVQVRAMISYDEGSNFNLLTIIFIVHTSCLINKIWWFIECVTLLVSFKLDKSPYILADTISALMSSSMLACKWILMGECSNLLVWSNVMGRTFIRSTTWKVLSHKYCDCLWFIVRLCYQEARG